MISNQSGIIGGLEFAKETFKLIDKKIKPSYDYPTIFITPYKFNNDINAL